MRTLVKISYIALFQNINIKTMSFFGKNKLRDLSAAELSTIFSNAINEHLGLFDKAGNTPYECTINTLEFSDNVGGEALKIDLSFREDFHHETTGKKSEPLSDEIEVP